MLTFHFPKLGFFTRRDTWDAGKVGKIKIRLLTSAGFAGVCKAGLHLMSGAMLQCVPIHSESPSSREVRAVS
jgi:hypothetical protein